MVIFTVCELNGGQKSSTIVTLAAERTLRLATSSVSPDTARLTSYNLNSLVACVPIYYIVGPKIFSPAIFPTQPSFVSSGSYSSLPVGLK